MRDVAYFHALHVRSLRVIRDGKLACLRCGGSGEYHTYGRCFRCDGSGIDPAQPKAPTKSKRLKQQREWASGFDEQGKPLPVMCPWCEHVIDNCVVRACAAHRSSTETQ